MLGAMCRVGVLFLSTVLVCSCRVIHLADNVGASVARNLAAASATTKYVMFFDDDDDMMPRCIETLLVVAETTGAHVVTSWVQVRRCLVGVVAGVCVNAFPWLTSVVLCRWIRVLHSGTNRRSAQKACLHGAHWMCGRRLGFLGRPCSSTRSVVAQGCTVETYSSSPAGTCSSTTHAVGLRSWLVGTLTR